MSPRRSGGAARQTAGPGHSPVRSFNSREMPFWDDLDLTTLHDFGGRLLLVGVFNKPGRFRLDIVGEDLTAAAGKQVAGLFADEIRPSPPLDYLGSQISAAVEAGAADLSGERSCGWSGLSPPSSALVGRRPAQHGARRHRLERGLTPPEA